MIVERRIAPQVLLEKGECIIRGAGSSMEPIIYTGDLIHLKKVPPEKLRKDDAVYCKCHGSSFVHKIAAVDEKNQRYLIASNRGNVNGWISPQGIYGLATQINDKVLISEEELQSR